MPFTDIAECPEPSELLVHEHGWQSWSPTGTYPATASSPRPASRPRQVIGWRADAELPPQGFQGEGLLAVGPRAGGLVRIWHASRADRAIPSIRARMEERRLVVSSDAPVDESRVEASSLDAALASWAEGWAAAQGALRPASIPPVWCSWYQYLETVTAADVAENLSAAAALDLPLDVFQVDDGHQAEVGDWLETSPRFGRPLAEVAAQIRASGRRPGIWTAPFLIGERSRVAGEHPAWMVGGADPGRHWQQRLGVLDVTEGGAAEWLSAVFRRLSEWGFDYFKLDFLYAGALPGRRRQDVSPIDAYRAGLRLIRQAVGPRATLVGCGAPILPSLGLVDAMRIGPDISLRYEPGRAGDLSAPSQRGAALNARARAFLHGRFWVNDPDCVIARPEMERREAWAGVVERWGGLRASGDRLRGLDGWGLEATRRLLRPSPTGPLVDA